MRRGKAWGRLRGQEVRRGRARRGLRRQEVRRGRAWRKLRGQEVTRGRARGRLRGQEVIISRVRRRLRRQEVWRDRARGEKEDNIYGVKFIRVASGLDISDYFNSSNLTSLSIEHLNMLKGSKTAPAVIICAPL